MPADYPNRAAAAAAVIPVAKVRISYVSQGHLCQFVRDNAGTALQTGDGQKWSPAGRATPLHWGDYGEDTDEHTSLVQAAVDWTQNHENARASELPIKYVDLCGLMFNVSSGIAVTGHECIIENGALNAIGSNPWGSGTAVLTLGRARANGTERFSTNVGTRNVLVVCNKLTSAFLEFGGVARHEFSIAHGFTEFGFKAYSASGRVSRTEWINCKSQEFTYTDPAGEPPENRTGASFDIDASDCHVLGCTGAVSRYPLIVRSGWHNRITGSHFWNGFLEPTVVHGCVTVLKDAHNTTFSNNYYDNGPIEIHGKFNHSFMGGVATRGTFGIHSHVFWLYADEPDTTGEGLVSHGITTGLSGAYVTMIEGEGSWVPVPDRRMNITMMPSTGRSFVVGLQRAANMELTGDLTFRGFSPDGYQTIRSDSGLRYNADYDENSSDAHAIHLWQIRGVDAAAINSARHLVGYAGIRSTQAIGYRTGAGSGGTVTQATSKSTSVTLNRYTGRITTHDAALAAGASVTFQVTNSVAGGMFFPFVAVRSPAGKYTAHVSAVGASSFSITLTNTTGGALSEAVDIQFISMAGSVD